MKIIENRIITTPGNDALDEWWELSYAHYLTIPRCVMQSMPDDWKSKMAALLSELDATIDWRPRDGGRYRCYLTDSNGRFVKDKFSEYRHVKISNKEKVNDK